MMPLIPNYKTSCIKFNLAFNDKYNTDAHLLSRRAWGDCPFCKTKFIMGKYSPIRFTQCENCEIIFNFEESYDGGYVLNSIDYKNYRIYPQPIYQSGADFSSIEFEPHPEIHIVCVEINSRKPYTKLQSGVRFDLQQILNKVNLHASLNSQL